MIKNNIDKYNDVTSVLRFDSCPDLTPKVSITIPTFKRPNLLKEALYSSKEQIADVEFEVIVVDNDSDGEYEEEIKKIINCCGIKNIRYFRNEKNIGMFGNWNRCISLSRAEYITILNDDDILDKFWLKTVYQERHREIVLVKCGVFSNVNDVIKTNNQHEKCNYRIHKINEDVTFLGNPNPGTLGILWNKKVLIEHGGFNEEMYPSADYDLLSRIVISKPIFRIDKVLAHYRWGENESLKPEVINGFLLKDKIIRTNVYFNKSSAILGVFLDYLTLRSQSKIYLWDKNIALKNGFFGDGLLDLIMVKFYSSKLNNAIIRSIYNIMSRFKK